MAGISERERNRDEMTARQEHPGRVYFSDSGVMTAITVVLDLPFAEQSPNVSVGHWSKKSKPVKASREYACLRATDVMNRAKVWTPPRWKQAEMIAVFYYEKTRRRDRSNSAACLKAYEDGIADAGIVENDCGMIPLPPELLVDKANPRVELTIRAVASLETP